MLRLPTLSFCVLAIGLVLAANAEETPAPYFSGDPEIVSNLYGEWEAALEPPLSQATHFEVHHFHLLAAAGGEEFPRFHRVRLGPSGFEGEIEKISVEGLPDNFRLSHFRVVPPAQQAVLAGHQGGTLVFYRARILQEGFGEFEQLPPWPEEDRGEEIRFLLPQGTHFIAVTERTDIEGALRIAGWVGNAAAPLEAFRWQELPSADSARTGYAALALNERLVLAGGVEIDPFDRQRLRPARIAEGLELAPPTIGIWRDFAQPMLYPMEDVVGTNYGLGIYLAPREPMRLGEDVATSMTMLMSQDWREGAISPWKRVVLSGPAAPVETIRVSPGHSQLLLLTHEGADEAAGEEARPILRAYGIAPALQGRRETMEEAERRHMRRIAVPESDIFPEEAAAQAIEMDTLLLVILTDNEDDDLDTRYRMNAPRFRHLTMGITTAYFGGELGREQMTRYGAGASPAFLLLDPIEDRVITRHEGSFPEGPELFRLTSPARDPRPEAADSDP